MFKKLHSFVVSVVSLCCIFSMLFLNTLFVSASSTEVDNITDLVDFTNPILQTGNTTQLFKYYCANDPYFYNTVYGSYTSPYPRIADVCLAPSVDTRNIDIDPYKTYCVYLSTNGTGYAVQFVSPQGHSGNILSVQPEGLLFESLEGVVLNRDFNSGNYIYRGYALVQGIDLLNGYTSSYNSTCNYNCKVSFTFRSNLYTAAPEGDYYNVTLPYNLEIYPLKEAYQYMNTTDMETKRQIQHTEGVLDNDLQESNRIADDTNTTTHSIFDSISSFFGSFFNNLIGVFVPESGYFENWFSRVNTMLADKLGILYYPFNLFITFVQELVQYFSEQQNTCVITFPEIAFTNRATNERYVFLQAQQVDLGSYSFAIGQSDNSSVVGTNGWTTPVQIIRRLNSIVLFFLFIGLLRQKLNLIIRGEDKDT